MTKMTFGKLDSWQAPEARSSSIDKEDFLSMKDNKKYTMRIVQDGPCKFFIHWEKDAQSRPRRINCALENCVLCAAENKPQVKYMIAALNREKGRVQAVEFGQQVYSQVFTLKNNNNWGDPRNYDIEIDKDLTRTDISKKYIVTGIPRNMGPVTPEEAVMVRDFLARMNIEKFATPSKNDEILRKLGRATITPASPDAAWSTVPSQSAPATAVVEDDDFDFQ